MRHDQHGGRGVVVVILAHPVDADTRVAQRSGHLGQRAGFIQQLQAQVPKPN